MKHFLYGARSPFKNFFPNEYFEVGDIQGSARDIEKERWEYLIDWAGYWHKHTCDGV